MVNYPNGIKKKEFQKINTYDNRGMNFEHLINISNIYYRERKIAIIYKKPTPIKVVEMDNKNKCIKKAFFAMPSTTDYNGIYDGKYIDFEAKETLSLTSFPLANIHDHQIKHLIDTSDLGGISFIIVNFRKLNEIYVLDIKSLTKLERKSVPLDYFREFGMQVKQTYLCPIDYLDAVKKLYKK